MVSYENPIKINQKHYRDMRLGKGFETRNIAKKGLHEKGKYICEMLGIKWCSGSIIYRGACLYLKHAVS